MLAGGFVGTCNKPDLSRLIGNPLGYLADEIDIYGRVGEGTTVAVTSSDNGSDTDRMGGIDGLDGTCDITGGSNDLDGPG